MSNKLAYVVMCNTGAFKAERVSAVINSAEDMLLFVNCYRELGNKAFSHQVRKGLRFAFNKFSTVSNENVVMLRDLMLQVHPKPANEQQAKFFNNLYKGEIQMSVLFLVPVKTYLCKHKDVFTEYWKSGKAFKVVKGNNLDQGELVSIRSVDKFRNRYSRICIQYDMGVIDV